MIAARKTQDAEELNACVNLAFASRTLLLASSFLIFLSAQMSDMW